MANQQRKTRSARSTTTSFLQCSWHLFPFGSARQVRRSFSPEAHGGVRFSAEDLNEVEIS